MAKRELKLFEPWAPPELTLPEVAAIKAVAQGNASPDQQKRAMRTIIEKLADTYQETFCPGEDGERNSAYAQGKRRVGLMLVTYINAPLKNFKDPNSAPTERT
jgi:hypothetical protein